ncbi:MAG: 2OG-Fe(II) oxygenase [bacterium]|nr:2OG-Fe(II) oxygenase [bacterium]
MTTATLEQISGLLSEIGARETFSTRRTRPVDDLHLEVKGLGRLDFPVSRGQARRLCQIGRPARYGQGERTLLDRRVRDTWQIPKSRVKIDLRRWKRTLLPVLEQLGADLGVPAGCRLKAELHAMLVYAPGQFFLPHQDSEKSDEMVGTLVVTLPSSFKGGALVVEHQGESATYRGSRKYLSFVAFYADCRHEVRPVQEGYRISLTYNLMLDTSGAATDPGSIEAEPAVVDALAESLREHFETPLPPRWQRDAPPREPPNRLVYLLDHQYSERGLGWQRLKGNDAARSAALRAAAERCDCELVLALTEIHETWSCMEPGWNDRWYGRHRSWQRDGGDEWYDDDPPAPPVDDPDAYELEDLIDSGITLTRWIDSSGAKAASIVTHVDDDEVCSTTPSSALQAHASEYEGYMGNWGNTMDRWYRRAAIVLWPRQRAFAVRAEASPAWAVRTLRQRLRSGRMSEARDMATSLLPFWAAVTPHEEGRGFLDQALRVAEGLEESALAASLLQPFRLEALTPGRAPALVALFRRYGEGWTRSLISEWTSRRPSHERDPLTWLGSLPRLCQALCAADEDAGRRFSELLSQDRWASLKEEIEGALRLGMPSLRDKEVAKLARPILGILESAGIIGAQALRDEAAAFLCAEENELLLPGLVRVLRAAARRPASKKRASPALGTIRRHCVRRMKERLRQPARDDGDWSIEPPGNCDCELCATLATFLADPSQQRLEWPIAKAKRMHVHRTIDAHELPVHHTTRRSGSPYTLVLNKTRTLFEREAKQRRSWQADLDWMSKQGSK